MTGEETGGRGQALAARFTTASDALIATVANCPDERWMAMCPDEQQPVGVVARHVASALPIALGWVRMVVDGQPLPPLTPEMIDDSNARQAEKHAHPPRDEVLALLRRNCPMVAETLASLSDEQLARHAPFVLRGGREVSAEQLANFNLVQHVESHLAGIRKALAA
jgi:hypothetical protein